MGAGGANRRGLHETISLEHLGKMRCEADTVV